MNGNKLVSIVIPTRNSSRFLENCLKSIKKQTYKHIETLIVDGKSTDMTISIAKKYNVSILTYVPRVPVGTFDAPHKRNYGMGRAKGIYVYYVDADMELSKSVVEEAVAACEKGSDAVIIAEDSFGIGPWARAKNLERRCYWGDDTVEAPRFFKKSVWKRLGGLDENLGGGGEDWDFYQKLKDSKYKTVRIKSLVRHNEGDLKLKSLLKKRFMYGRDTLRYISKRPKAGTVSYFPIRKSYLNNWKSFLMRPKDTIFFLIMRTSEYGAGFSGMIYSLLKR